MKFSRRALRMEKRHKKARHAALGLVSLMDIFTILVFFLLVNQSSVAQAPNAKTIRLPQASSEQLPRETLVIEVNAEALVIQGRKVADVARVIAADDPMIPELVQELRYLTGRKIAGAEPGAPREITIMGDKEIPYRLLRKIMVTCSQSEFGNISLAVVRRERKAGPG